MLQVAGIAAHSAVHILRLAVTGALEVERLATVSAVRVGLIHDIDIDVKIEAGRALVVDCEQDLTWPSWREPIAAFYTDV